LRMCGVKNSEIMKDDLPDSTRSPRPTLTNIEYFGNVSTSIKRFSSAPSPFLFFLLLRPES